MMYCFTITCKTAKRHIHARNSLGVDKTNMNSFEAG